MNYKPIEVPAFSILPEEINSKFENFPGPYKIGYTELNKILPGFSNQELAKIVLPAEHKYGEMNPHEITLLTYLVKYLNPEKVFEFGTFEGLMTLNIASNTPENTVITTIDQKAEPTENGSETKTAYAIDGFNSSYINHDRVGIQFQKTPYNKKIHSIRQDSTKFNTSPYKHSIDFIFIDANHQYDFVKSDSNKAFEMLAPGGVIVWHDYGRMHDWPGVSSYLAEIAREGKSLFWLEGCNQLTNSPVTLVAYFDFLKPELHQI